FRKQPAARRTAGRPAPGASAAGRSTATSGSTTGAKTATPCGIPPSPRLQLVGAPDNVREAIAGYEHGSVINRHYTETNLALLKRFLDRIDYGIEVDEDNRGFPVIRRRSLLDRQVVTVVARIDGNGRLARLTISDPADPAR